MKELRLRYEDALVAKSDISRILTKLKPEIKRMDEAAKGMYHDKRASINLPLDRKALAQVKRMVKEKGKLKPEYLVVVGIGGSNLGTIAVQEAVLGKLYNQTTKGIKVLYADTVDTDSISAIKNIVESVLRKRKNVLINVVSKSGTTTETIANFEVLLAVLKKYKKDYEKYVVVTTDKGSALYNLAEKHCFSTLEVPKKVGGRYSIFSPVGLFPLGVLGVNLEALMRGAGLMRKRCLSKNALKNPAVLSAAVTFIHYKKGKNVHDMFLFGNDLEGLGKWSRQLVAESVGKGIAKGITPTVSIGSTDLHSMAQLYLGGPSDKFISFVKLEKFNTRILIPNYKEFEDLVQGVQRKALPEVMGAIYGGVKRAFKKGKRPFMEVYLPDKSPASVAQFLQLKMMETMYLGFLMGVDPFDQPAVERYKSETRSLLRR